MLIFFFFTNTDLFNLEGLLLKHFYGAKKVNNQ